MNSAAEPATGIAEPTLSDEALLTAFLDRRDAQAFEQLVARYQRFAYRVAYSICNQSAFAEEAVQDAFLQLARAPGKIQASSIIAFRSWFFTVVSNAARHGMRSEWRTQNRERRVQTQESAVFRTQHGLGELAEESSTAASAALQRALGTLSDELRVPIVLHYLEGLQQGEIGALTGVSASQISRRIARGLDLLRKRMADAGMALPAAALPAMLKSQDLLPLPGTLAQALAGLKPGKLALEAAQEASRRVPVAVKPAGAWLAWGAAGLLAIAAAGYGMQYRAAPRPLGAPVASQKAAAAESKPAIARTYFKAEWSCTTLESVKDLAVTRGSWSFVPDEGKQGLGLMETGAGVTKLVLKVPRSGAPYRVTYKSCPDSSIFTGVYWNKYHGWGVAIFRNLAQPRSKRHGEWFSYMQFISSNHVDYWTDGKRTNFNFCSDSEADEMALCFSGKAKVRDIVVESISESEVPDYTVFRKALERTPVERRVGRVDAPEIPGYDPAKPVYMDFSGPVDLEAWSTPQDGPTRK